MPRPVPSSTDPAAGLAGAGAEVWRALNSLDAPSSAQLAAHLRLGRSTVDKALAALHARGLATR
ncbi:MAG: hypothetical protein L0Y54_13525, partial [Sporichthyaceae bacterium]|nr:hypothetical protein [Sporichthyaceae bacterium]